MRMRGQKSFVVSVGLLLGARGRVLRRLFRLVGATWVSLRLHDGILCFYCRSFGTQCGQLLGLEDQLRPVVYRSASLAFSLS